MISSLFLNSGYLLQIGVLGIALTMLIDRESAREYLFDGGRPPRRPYGRFLKWSSYFLFHPLNCCAYIGLIGVVHQPMALLLLPDEMLSAWEMWHRVAFVLFTFVGHSTAAFLLTCFDHWQSGPGSALGVMMAAAAAAVVPIAAQPLLAKSLAEDCVTVTNAICVATTVLCVLFGRATSSD